MSVVKIESTNLFNSEYYFFLEHQPYVVILPPQPNMQRPAITGPNIACVFELGKFMKVTFRTRRPRSHITEQRQEKHFFGETHVSFG